MKLLCLLLSCFTFGALPIQAATLHALLVADSNDAAIGAGAQENSKNLQKWFLQAASQLHMTPQIVVIEGAQFSCETIDSSVGKLKAAADDVVVFYYSGHGFRTSIEQSRFPDFYCGSQVFSAVTDALHTANARTTAAAAAPKPSLRFCSSNQTDRYCSLAGVVRALSAKGAHLTLAFADTCNVEIPIPAPPGHAKAQAAGPTDALTQLFVNSSGVLTMSGAVPKTYSWYLTTGGLFTTQLIAALNDSTDTSHTGKWSDVVDLATRKIDVDSSAIPPITQQPQADNQIH